MAKITREIDVPTLLKSIKDKAEKDYVKRDFA